MSDIGEFSPREINLLYENGGGGGLNEIWLVGSLFMQTLLSTGCIDFKSIEAITLFAVFDRCFCWEKSAFRNEGSQERLPIISDF